MSPLPAQAQAQRRPASAPSSVQGGVQGPVAHTYALLVGKNPGGPGQSALRFAEEDAKRMAEVLRELGHVPAAQSRVLLGPDKPEVLAALDAIGKTLEGHRARGEQAQFVFYYSGHARANAIHLGNEELALTELRERVLSLPSTLTLIVLDACQSGAFSNIKGAEPAAAFSYNSAARLETSGVAVMASSSATELSQESASLRGSYFTHHLIVGLRGAGDSDGNGVVSLGEAYRYAYDRTLSSTMRTAVGKQHVTLETSLKGHGDVPITFPAQARAQLELPKELSADVLVEHEVAVVAELRKARGSALRLALPAGAYSVVLRDGNALSLCKTLLQDGAVTQLAPQSCAAITESEAAAKGYFVAEPSAARPPREAWGFELSIGLGSSNTGAYTDRLESFGFQEKLFGDDGGVRFTLAASRQLSDHLSAVLDFRNLDRRIWRRDYLSTDEETRIERFGFWSYALGLHLRAHTDLFHEHLRLYAQLGGGLGYVHSELNDHTEGDVGPHLAASAGFFYMPWRAFGFTFQTTYAFAPMLSNAIGDDHDSGGLAITTGIRLRTWEQP